MRKYKPTSSGVRGTMIVPYRLLLSKKRAVKALKKGKKRGVGRNSAGRITTRHKGGGHKRSWRDVDFSYNKIDIPARIASVEYDPNRSAFIGLAVYRDGDRRYVVVPQEVREGTEFIVSAKAPVKPANRLPLSAIPVGTFVYNVSLKENGPAVVARSAGNYAQVVAQDGVHTHLKMPSTEVRKIMQQAWACVGAVSNHTHNLVNLGKAGRSRWKGIRPTVRGTAMNPVDHPHGGGEGRQGRGLRRAKSLWGKPTGKGQKTRTPKKYSNKLIVQRRKVGKRK